MSGDNRNKTKRGLISLAVSRPVAVLMLTLSVTVFGYVSYRQLAVDLMPDISYPSLTVRTEYPGAPADVEELVSRPNEQVLGIIHDLVGISSISRAGVSDVILEFRWGTDMDEAAQTVREKLGQVYLPKEAGKPLLLRYDPSMDPILRLGLYGATDEYRMRHIAENDIERELESISGVAAVKIHGGLNRQITIEVSQSQLEKYRLDIGQIMARLREENINVASGRLKEAETEYLVRSVNQFKSIEEIENLVITRVLDQKIRIRDIAKVIPGHKRREVITRINGKTSIEIAVYKEGDANLVEVADRVKRALGIFLANKPAANAEKQKNQKLRQKGASSVVQKLPKGMKLEILSDQSLFIKKAIHDLQFTAISGALLAIAVLFVFLKRLSSTLIIGIAIPISIVATFAPMYIGKVSINIMSLGGLALGVGMLVDTSIVVLEAIFRRREQGEELVESAIEGAREVAGAVTASTLTTISVFFPIVFVEGIAGQIFKDQALTVVFSLVASLAVALFLIPMLASRKFRADVPYKFSDWWRFKSIAEIVKFFRKRHSRKIWILLPLLLVRSILAILSELFGKLAIMTIALVFFVFFFATKATGYLTGPVSRSMFKVSEKALVWLHSNYSKALAWALGHKIFVLVPTLLLFVFSLALLEGLGKELIPKMRQGEFTLEVRLPVGTPIEKTDRILKPLETMAKSEPGVAVVSSHIGVERDASSSSEEGEHTGKILVCLSPGQLENEAKVISSLQCKLSEQPELCDVKVRYPSLFTFKTPIEVEVQGYDLHLLKKTAGEVMRAMKKISGFHDVRSNIARGNPELRVVYKRDQLAQYGLNIDEISYQVKNLLGQVATRYVLKDKDIDILVQVENAENLSVRKLENLSITPALSEQKKLKDVADIERVEGFSEIRRIDQRRAALVSADISGISLSSAVTRLEKNLAKLALPKDFNLTIAGQNEEMKVSLNSLKFAMALAIFLVYVVMASQFESLIQPFVIIVTLPLALIGVVLTLYLLQIPISIVVYIGMILLSGIVVNNAIVLVDCINQLQQKGMNLRQAVLKAGQLRLRPILMTTLTTVLGLLPVAGILATGQGQGQEIRAPMAITVIAGLISSTVLTLLVIPVAYSAAEELKALTGKV